MIVTCVHACWRWLTLSIFVLPCDLIVWCMILTCFHAWWRWLWLMLPIYGFSGVDCCSTWLLILLCIPSQRQICEPSSDDQRWSIVCVRNFSYRYIYVFFFFYLQVFVSSYSVACFSLNLDILVVSRCCGTWYILDACLCVRVPVEVRKSERVWIDSGLFCRKELFSYFVCHFIIFWNPKISFLCFQESVWRLQSKTGK